MMRRVAWKGTGDERREMIGGGAGSGGRWRTTGGLRSARPPHGARKDGADPLKASGTVMGPE